MKLEIARAYAETTNLSVSVPLTIYNIKNMDKIR